MKKRSFQGRFEWLSAFPLMIVTGILAILSIMTLAGAQSSDVRGREALFDFFQRLSPPDATSGNSVHLVLIDRESVDAIGPWPWPRTVLGELVTKAKEAGAKGVVLTEPVDTPDPLSPETIGDFWLAGASDEALAEQLALLPSTDKKLADAFASTPGAIGVGAASTAEVFQANSFQRADARNVSWISVSNGGAQYLALPAARYRFGLNDALRGSTPQAVVAIEPDSDGVVRRMPLLWALDDKPVAGAGLSAARIAGDADKIDLFVDAASANSQGRTIENVRINNAQTPLTAGGAMRLYFPKRTSLPTTSAVRLLTGSGSNAQLDGATVLIGLDKELGTSLKTARGDFSPVALHALAATQILSGNTPGRPGWAGYLEAFSVMLFGAAAIIAAQRFAFWRAAGFAAILSVVLILLSFAGFAIADQLLNPLPAATALFIGALSVAGGSAIGDVLRDDTVRGSFHDSLPEPAMKKLRDDGAAEILQGKYKEITVLACELRLLDEDLRQMETLPDDVTKMLAAATTELRSTILDTGGASDQAEGGRIFAYYGAPLDKADHVQAACAAALRLVESLDRINEDLEGSSRTRGLQMHLAIGAATGTCFVGPMGHGRNNRYSAIGPAIDRAALLRNQSEYYGPAMICDESVYRDTHHHFAYLELDKVEVRDDKRPFSIYALIGNPFIKSSKGFRALDDSYREFLTAYRSGDVVTARTHLDKAKQSPGARISLFDIYEDRLAVLEQTGVPGEWSGVYRLGG